MERRRHLLHELKLLAARDNDSSQLLAVLFRLLYGLPADLQLGAASFALYRYMVVFERHWPNVAWPRDLLHDVKTWLRRHQRSIPDEPSDPSPADLSFRFGFDALLFAVSNTEVPVLLTSSSCASVGAAIDAWASSDPEALDALGGRGVLDGSAARVAAQREWLAIGAWLEKQQITDFPEPADPEQIEHDLSCWKKREMLLLTPLPPWI